MAGLGKEKLGLIFIDNFNIGLTITYVKREKITFSHPWLCLEIDQVYIGK